MNRTKLRVSTALTMLFVSFSLLRCGPIGEEGSASGGGGGAQGGSGGTNAGSGGSNGGGDFGSSGAPWDWIGIVGTGQSLSTGTPPTTSTTQPYDNLMLS